MQAGVALDVRPLSGLLSAYLALQSRENARARLAAGGGFAARVLRALDEEAGPAPPLPPLMALPVAPAASIAGWGLPAAEDEPAPPPPPGRSPGHAARKPAAPRKRRAPAGGAARSVRFAPDCTDGLTAQLDPRKLDELLNSGDDAGLFALGERVASALPPLDRWGNEQVFRIEDLFPGYSDAVGAAREEEHEAFDAPPPSAAGGWEPMPPMPSAVPPPSVLPALPLLPMLPAGLDREAFIRGLHYG